MIHRKRGHLPIDGATHDEASSSQPLRLTRESLRQLTVDTEDLARVGGAGTVTVRWSIWRTFVNGTRRR